MTNRESGFDTLARLIKQESEDIRNELGGRIDSLEEKVHSGFARIDQEFASARSDIKSVRVDTDQLLHHTARIEKHLRLRPVILEE